MLRFTTLVLAGRRNKGHASVDGGGAHPSRVDLRGVPMLVRVVRALRDSPSVGRVVVTTDDPKAPSLVSALPSVELHRSLDSPSRSVLDFLEREPPDIPVIVVTADHALLTPAMVEHFAEASRRAGADLVVGLVEAGLVEARFPGVKRTFFRFRDAAFSGANLFAFNTPSARGAAAFWVRAEQHRKRPWRLVAAFGPVPLALFALRRLTLDAALERASDAIGARVRAVRMPNAEAAIDVDSADDLELVRTVLAARDGS